MVVMKISKRSLSTGVAVAKHFKLVIIGGGSGGCSTAAKFARKIDPKSIALIEPADMHYYQPMWTLVGGGIKTLEDSGKRMDSVLPKSISWIKEKAVEINPEKNQVKIDKPNAEPITYDFLIVAAGIQLKYDQVKGLADALKDNAPGICSNYSALYVNRTLESLKNFKKGNAIFTFPNTPIKCPGAPQKIMYIADSYLRKHDKRKDANLIFNTSLGVLFGVKKYADSLWEVVKKKDLKVNHRKNLIEVYPKEKKAFFEDLDKPGNAESFEYEMLHVTPAQGPHDFLQKNSGDLVDGAGYVALNKGTLQHTKYSNVFGIGDCTNLPTSKTAAAVAAQCGILERNLWNVMNGKDPSLTYDGYTSCPLITSYSKCILAEFDYGPNPLETLPINQGKERWISFQLKKQVMPEIYWKLMLNGRWNGPETIRKVAHLGLK